MPDHVHLIVWPTEADYDIARIRKAIKAPVDCQAIAWMEQQAPRWLARITRTSKSGAIGRRSKSKPGIFSMLWHRMGLVMDMARSANRSYSLRCYSLILFAVTALTVDQYMCLQRAHAEDENADDVKVLSVPAHVTTEDGHVIVVVAGTPVDVISADASGARVLIEDVLLYGDAGTPSSISYCICRVPDQSLLDPAAAVACFLERLKAFPSVEAYRGLALAIAADGNFTGRVARPEGRF